MALFNTNAPLTPQQAKPRVFEAGNAWDWAKLNLAGSRPDGSPSIFGKIVSNGLPVAAGIVSAYFTGSYQLGSTIGNGLVQGLGSWEDKQLRGTDTQEVARAYQSKQNGINSKISGYAGIAQSLYGLAGGQSGGKMGSSNGNAFKDGSILGNMFNDSESRKLLRGVSGDSIRQFMNDDAGVTSSVFGSLNDDTKILGSKNLNGITAETTLPYASLNGFNKGGVSLPNLHPMTKKAQKLASPYVFFKGGASETGGTGKKP